MRFTPRPYQKLIVDHIHLHERAAVWAGMGLGKTVATLTAIEQLQRIGMGPALILAPLRVAQSTWPDEVANWDHLRRLRVSVVTGAPAARRAALFQEADVYCTNYESLPWLCETLDGEWPFAMVVADESTRLKSFRTRQGGTRAQALAKVAFRSERFVELTGTPASNGFLDIWGQFWFLDQGERLGRSMSQYQEKFFRPVRVGNNAFAVRWEPMPFTEEAVLSKTRDLALKLNAEDWFSLKEPVVTNVEVRLPKKARAAYDSMEEEFFVAVDDGVIEAANAAVKTGKLLQLAGGALYRDELSPEKPYETIHDVKLTALSEIVAEACGMPVLVTYQFKHEAARILDAFPQARLLDKDPKTIRDWNAGRIPMLLAHPASCGHGLSLQDGGNILVFFSTGWNLEEHEQIVERIGPARQAQSGHARPVFIYNIIARDTVDEVVQERIRSKREVLDLLLERRKHGQAL